MMEFPVLFGADEDEYSLVAWFTKSSLFCIFVNHNTDNYTLINPNRLHYG